jgi:hypothetical protein
MIVMIGEIRTPTNGMSVTSHCKRSNTAAMTTKITAVPTPIFLGPCPFSDWRVALSSKAFMIV